MYFFLQPMHFLTLYVTTTTRPKGRGISELVVRIRVTILANTSLLVTVYTFSLLDYSVEISGEDNDIHKCVCV